MLCCLVGGVLVAAIARAAARNPNRRQSLPAAVLMGVGAGTLSVELFFATLVPLGLADAPGSLVVRLALLVVSAAVAAIGVAGGGGAALLSARGSAFLGLSAGAGALITEGIDIHVVGLHDPAGALGAVLVHLVPVGFLCAGLLRAGRLAAVEQPVCHCAGACRCGCLAGDTHVPGPGELESALS